MAVAALDVYREHSRELRLDHTAVERLTDGLEIVQSAEKSQALNARRGPM